MKNKRLYNIILLGVVILSIGVILLINNTDMFASMEASTIMLVKQYLKVTAFAGFIGLVYLYFKK